MATYEELREKAEELQDELMEIKNYSEVAYKLLNELIYELEEPTEYQEGGI